MTFSSYRLQRYLEVCSSNTHQRTWRRLNVSYLMRALGISRATFFRSLSELRELSHSLSFRTVFFHGESQKGNWGVLWRALDTSNTVSNPHTHDIHGRLRHVRHCLRSPDIQSRESHSLLKEKRNKWNTPGVCSISCHPPPKIIKLAWFVARRWELLTESKEFEIDFEIHRVVGWLSRLLIDGAKVDSLNRAFHRQLDLVHAHNTDVNFQESAGRRGLKRRGFGFLATQVSLEMKEELGIRLSDKESRAQSYRSHTPRGFSGSIGFQDTTHRCSSVSDDTGIAASNATLERNEPLPVSVAERPAGPLQRPSRAITASRGYAQDNPPPPPCAPPSPREGGPGRAAANARARAARSPEERGRARSALQGLRQGLRGRAAARSRSFGAGCHGERPRAAGQPVHAGAQYERPRAATTQT